jgi:hypothetical protein
MVLFCVVDEGPHLTSRQYALQVLQKVTAAAGYDIGPLPCLPGEKRVTSKTALSAMRILGEMQEKLGASLQGTPGNPNPATPLPAASQPLLDRHGSGAPTSGGVPAKNG